MSSGEEHDYGEGSKKRRLQRACDICRRKKIKCDSGQIAGDRCSNCIAFNLECTHTVLVKKRGPRNTYVEDLEERVKKLERMLNENDPAAGPLQRSTPERNPSMSTTVSSRLSPSLSTFPAFENSPDADTYEDDDMVQAALAENLQSLAIDSVSNRFFGKSSGFMLLQTALDIKKEMVGSSMPLLLDHKRPEYWTSNPWEKVSAEKEIAHYVYPDDDLIMPLVDLFFTRVNYYIPLLHRPTYERAVADGLHHRDFAFGATLLIVCAIGSRYSDDPRVFLEGAGEKSAGWKWFDQVHAVRKSFHVGPKLYELQTYCLSTMYMQGLSSPHGAWTMAGIGLRFALEVGAHRRKYPVRKLTVESELWKRAFWVLLSSDRVMGAFLGRPGAIQDEDFDIDLPVECDDEYWENPDQELAFKQPPGKPSVIAYFNCHLRLCEVLGVACRSLYPVKKVPILANILGQQWQHQIVSELDSSLNKWIDSVPSHLKWDATRENLLFFNQSALLYSTYYNLQIQIHRPFIPSPRKSSPLSFPSLAICTNAARACSHVLDIQAQRGPLLLPQLQLSVFTAGVVLLVNVWGGKKAGLSVDPKKEMKDVYSCINILRHNEKRWNIAGRLRDILYDIATVGELPLPHTPPASNKRTRDETRNHSAEYADTLFSNEMKPRSAGANAPIALPTDPLAGSAAKTPTQRYLAHQSQSLHQSFALPLYSAELGRLPVHGYVDFPSVDPEQFIPGTHWYSDIMAPQRQKLDGGGVLPPELALGGGAGGNPLALDAALLQGTPPNAYAPPHLGQHVLSPPFDAGSIPLQPPLDFAQVSPTAYDIDSFETLDSDTVSMWSHAPTGFDLEDWSQYISNVGFTQSQDAGGMGLGG